MYYWVPKTKRNKSLEYFKDIGSESFLKEHETTLFSLLHPTEKDLGKYDISSNSFTVVMKQIFANGPTRKNQQQFFQNPVIQRLWWGTETTLGFISSTEMKKCCQDLTSYQKALLFKHFSKINEKPIINIS